MKKAYLMYAAAMLAGALIWIVIVQVSGRSEAWDSDLYFSMGMPAMCVVSFALALAEPERSWRWGIAPSVGQFVWLLLANGPGNLLPLGVVVFAVFSLPSVLAARAGAWVAARFAA